MSKSMINFTKGVVTGVVVGTTVSIVMKSFTHKPVHHQFMRLNHKRGVGKMIKNIGSAISHINDMWR